MDRQTFEDGMNWLEKCFGHKQTLERREHFWEKLGQVHDDLWSKATHIAVDRCKIFPSPEEMGKFVIEAREQEWQKEKGKELKHRHPLSRPQTGNPMVKGLLSLFYRHIDRAIMRKEYANELMKLHEKYPDFGLNKIATDIMLRVSELPEKKVGTQFGENKAQDQREVHLNKNGGKNNGEQKENGQKGPTQTEEGQKRGTEPFGKPKWDIF